jgi:hypothetical protein
MREPRTSRAVLALLGSSALAALLLGAAPTPSLAAPGPGAGETARFVFTLPLPSPELPDGVLTVKVAATAEAPVDLLHVEAGAAKKQSSAPVGADGRARFEGLRAGETYAVALGPSGAESRSEPFLFPAKGGLRLLASPSSSEGGSASGAGMPPGHPGGAGVGSGSGSGGRGAMPPGHPRTEPPGHTEEDASEEGSDEEAGSGSGAAAIEKAADLPARSVEVLVRQRRGQAPVVGVAVTLVTGRGRKGAPSLRKELRTDAAGHTRFEIPEAAERATLSIYHDGFTYRSSPLKGPFDSGLRATFAVLGRTRDRASVVFGPRTNIVLQVAEESVSFMEILALENRGEEIFDPGEGLSIPLPSGAVGVDVPEGDTPSIVKLEADKTRLRLVAPVAPGVLPLRVFFQLPYKGARLELRQALPLPLEKGIVAVIGEGGPRVESPLVEKTERHEEGDQRSTLYTLSSAAGAAQLSFALVDLPHRDRTALTVVLVLSGLIVLGALGVTLASRSARRPSAEDREALLEELAAIEARPAGTGAAAKRRARQREVLLESLRAAWEE